MFAISLYIDSIPKEFFERQQLRSQAIKFQETKLIIWWNEWNEWNDRKFEVDIFDLLDIDDIIELRIQSLTRRS